MPSERDLRQAVRDSEQVKFQEPETQYPEKGVQVAASILSSEGPPSDDKVQLSSPEYEVEEVFDGENWITMRKAVVVKSEQGNELRAQESSGAPELRPEFPSGQSGEEMFDDQSGRTPFEVEIGAPDLMPELPSGEASGGGDRTYATERGAPEQPLPSNWADDPKFQNWPQDREIAE